MKNKNRLTNKLLTRYLLSTFILIAGTIFFVLLLQIILGSRVWYETDFFYPFLSFINNHLTQVLLVVVFLLWVFTTYLFVWRAAGYLDETITATKQIITNPKKEIEMSNDLSDVSVELNRVRTENIFLQQTAKEAEQKKNDLIVYLAHDLRTPLTSIIGYLTLLEESPDLPRETRVKYTGITLEKAYRLENLINEFFEITRFNLATVSLVTRPTELSFMLEQFTSEFLPMMTDKNLTWKKELAENVWVDLDTEKFERVLDNLFKNAINYADKNSSLNLTLEKTRDFAILELENNGPHLPEDRIERIFEPFFRADSARSTNGGAGLGLSIAKSLVESHGGELKAKSSGNQFTMTMTLPLTKEKS